MTTKLPASFLPAKFQVLSGSALKLIAITLMLIDHTGLMILYNYPATTATLFSFGGVDYSWYRIFRDIGRAAFPIFCFLLVEGFLHTHNRKKYGLNLFLFACISEIPWNFMFTNTWRYEKQNVFFTLFLGYLAFCALEYFWDNQKMQLVCVLALLTVSVFLKADYGWRGFVFRSCTGSATTKPPRRSSEAAGFTMNGKPALLFFPLICTMVNVDL